MKRHGYYCRSRGGVNIPRTRSCIACARGKARCDNRRPECSRCITKGIECHYPANTRKGPTPRVLHDDDTSTSQRNVAALRVAGSPPVVDPQEANQSGGMNFENPLFIPDSEFMTLGGDGFDLDIQDIDLSKFLDQPTSTDLLQYSSTSSSSDSTSSTNEAIRIPSSLSSHMISIPPIPTYAFRSMLMRPNLKTGTQRITNLILHTLKSYPLMMLRDNILPPFIHPRFTSHESENNNMEPLTNCIALMHMISSGIQGSRKLFWKNVRMECERILNEVCSVLSDIERDLQS